MSQIAQIDDARRHPFKQSGRELGEVEVSSDLAMLIGAMIQHELSKRGRWAQTDELSYRVALLERDFERLRMPEVQYVHFVQQKFVMEDRLEITSSKHTAIDTQFPKAMIIFYSLGLFCSLIFAALITLSALGTNLIHPFLSLLGLVGGLGWLTTAWTDLLLWKRERILGKPSSEGTASNTTSFAV
jgi:hypothetical protein